MIISLSLMRKSGNFLELVLFIYKFDWQRKFLPVVLYVLGKSQVKSWLDYEAILQIRLKECSSLRFLGVTSMLRRLSLISFSFLCSCNGGNSSGTPRGVKNPVLFIKLLGERLSIHRNLWDWVFFGLLLRLVLLPLITDFLVILFTIWRFKCFSGTVFI